MRRAEGHPPGLLRAEEEAAQRARPARCRARGEDLRDIRGEPGKLRGAEGLRRAREGRRADLAQARRAPHARERLGRHGARLRQEAEGRGQTGRAAGERGSRPGQARPLGGRAEPRMVRGHHLRAHAPGMALPRRGHGHMVEDDSRLVDVGEHGGRPCRRRAQDGDSEAAPEEGGASTTATTDLSTCRCCRARRCAKPAPGPRRGRSRPRGTTPLWSR